jgi:DNA-binding MarR family transcriptional regulator
MMCMHHISTATDLPCAGATLRKASRAITRIYDEALAPVGMTSPQRSILRAIARHDGTPLSRLAENMVMDRSSLYRSLAPMIQAGWVRVENARAGRAKLVFMTDMGRQALAEADGYWAVAQRRVVEAFGTERWAALAEALGTLTAIGVDAAP